MRQLWTLLSALVLACAGPTGDSRAKRAAAERAEGIAPVDSARAPDTTPAPDRPVLTIRVLEVTSRAGGGDAILVADSAASPPRHVLIDAGDDGTAAAALRALGVRSLDLMVLTHAHHDHYGGMDEVLSTVPVRAVALNGQVRTAATYRRLLARIRDEVPIVLVVDSVRRVRLGEGDEATLITLLPPLPRYLATDTGDGEKLNEGSLAVRVERAGFSFLSTGDAEDEGNRHFATRFSELVDVDVLKVGHHGSADATQPSWLAATTPRVAIISANGTTHPHAETLALFRQRAIPLYCTPQHGTVTVRVKRDGIFAVLTERAPTAPCEPGSQRR